MGHIYIDADYVEKNLSSGRCISLMEEVLREQEEGCFVQYLRTQTILPNRNIFGVMPSYSSQYFGAKVLSVYPENFRNGLPSHQGAILLFDEKTGAHLATVDAGSVTKIRTGAVSAVATKHLAVSDPKVLCIIGCGEQGESHLKALQEVFRFRKVCLFDMGPGRAERMIPFIREGTEIQVCGSASEAAGEADVICTLTPGNSIVLDEGMVREGAHINAVGACAPSKRELSSELVACSIFIGDNRDSVMKESGDFLFPLKEGLIGDDHMVGTLGEYICGKKALSREPKDITVFEALGMAVEDIKCAIYLYEKKRGES